MASEKKETKIIYKRFPTDLDILELHFLNDKKASGELFTILLIHSVVRYNDRGTPYTFCARNDLNFTQLAKEVFKCSKTTLYNKLKYLIEKGYIEPMDDGFKIKILERRFKDVPLETLKYLKDTLSLDTIKVYLYLGIMLELKQKVGQPYYNFTKEELIERCGIIRGRLSEGLETAGNLLDILKKLGLINFRIIYLPCQDANLKGYTYSNYQIYYWTTAIQKTTIEERMATQEEIQRMREERIAKRETKINQKRVNKVSSSAHGGDQKCLYGTDQKCLHGTDQFCLHGTDQFCVPEHI